MGHKKYQILNSAIVYEGRAFDVRRDLMRLPDGQTAAVDVVDHVGAVTILPLDGQGNILFVCQYRHAIGQELLELPAGTLEPGEPPEICAQREIREETGMAADKIRKIGEFFLAPGYSTEYMYVFLATGLHPDPLPGDADEFIRVQAVPLADVYKMIETGEIQDAKSLAALLLNRSWLD